MRIIVSILLMACAAELSAAEIVGYQKYCNGKKCWYVPIYGPSALAPAVQAAPTVSALAVQTAPTAEYATFPVEPPVEPSAQPLAIGEAASTPTAEVVRVINLLPKPEVAFVDFGCGYDARWCVAAAEKWKCKCVGVERDSRRAAAARERVRNLGLSHLITITEGDVATAPVTGDVAVAYLYPEALVKLKPRLRGYKAFASYIHQPPGMSCTKSGDTWIYQPQIQATHVPQQGAVWNGVSYSGPLCNNPNCAMCNSIRQQLGYR